MPGQKKLIDVPLEGVLTCQTHRSKKDRGMNYTSLLTAKSEDIDNLLRKNEVHKNYLVNKAGECG